MNLIKIILIALGLFVAVMLALTIVGIISGIVFYALLLGVLVLAGKVGYKLLKRTKKTPKLEEKTPIGIADLTDADRTLEEYKRKYLSQ